MEDFVVKRWIIDTSCECGRFGDDVNAWEDKDGEWVKYEDIKHLLQHTSPNSDYAKCTKCGYETVPMVYCPHCNGYITVPNEHSHAIKNKDR